jgi:hypothetical protein
VPKPEKGWKRVITIWDAPRFSSGGRLESGQDMPGSMIMLPPNYSSLPGY